ncbi:hypothetical protein Atc_0768 [Acidithiobacillus caldus SM-1]|uniref:Uncharacterized protein n=1 Tax=Acidithiobacillus caldus (strain SM-1) TaxID=990288 RepID=F9ZKY0_ACICS|nr:hypothetical protein Atc_0768 [Acidithiobacillus caldus SM-1]
MIAHIQDAVKGNDDRFFGLCDELRGELNELAGILIDYVTPGFLDDKYGRKQNLRTLVLMVSHIELMFLYAQKNRASVMHYRREIDATVEEFLHCYARIAESVVL